MSVDLSTGSVVAGYRISRLIGRGATGAVYLAEDGDGELVALKVLLPELSEDARFRARFLHESEIASELAEPHVVPTRATGEHDGTLFLVMPYIDGPDLRQILRREGPLAPERAVELVGQIGRALDAAHALGLVHRDVKPGNVLVASREAGEHAYLCDFGLAKHLSSVNSLTGERAFVGTIAYISPEQIEGSPIDGRADVYSLGCMLYECLTGEPPFARESELAAVYAHINEAPPRASETRPGVPAGFDEVIARALAKSPGDRPASCGELTAACLRALHGAPPERRSSGRRRLLAAFAAVAVVAAAIVAFAVLRGGGSTRVTRLAVPAHSIGLIDPRSDRVVATVPFASQPWDVAFDSRQAWVLLGDERRVARVDLRSHAVRSSTRLPFTPGGIATGDGAAWVTESAGTGLVRLDARTGRVTRTSVVTVKGNESSTPTGIAVGAGSVWVARGAEAVRVDTASGRVLARIATPIAATSIVFARGAVWVASAENGRIVRIDPATNRITASTPLHGTVTDLAVDDSSVWVSIVPDDLVYRLSPDDGSVLATVPAGPWPATLSSGGRLWIADARGRQIVGVDGAGRRQVLATTGAPWMARAHRGLLWVSVAALDPAGPASTAQALRIPLTDDVLGSADPAVTGGPVFAQLAYATCAYLLNYPDEPGLAGRTLRPEVATAMPEVSADGRTYTFQIRQGFRFSPPSNQRVTAETFRYTIERTLSPRLGSGGRPSTYAPVLADVVGASAYASGEAPHISGIVVHGDTLTFRLVRAAGDFPARLHSAFFCPVPVGTPIAPSGPARPIAMAGPYYVSSNADGRVVLERNPSYTGTRPRRPARIVYTSGVASADAVSRVQHGEADYLNGNMVGYASAGPLAPGGPLDRAYGLASRAGRAGNARYEPTPAPGIDAIAFNTRRPLFRDVRMRRAVAYALDRSALARVFGERPDDRLVPPVVSGRNAPLAYPDPPDLAAARRLAGRGGGRTATLYLCGDPINGRVAEIMRSNLRKIGIRVRIEQSLGCLTGPETRKLAAADLQLVSHFDAVPDPAAFVEFAFGDAYTAPGYWHAPALEARVERARATRGSARIAAYARLETTLVRDAVPLAVYASAINPELFSARVGCKISQGALGLADLGALCLRS